MTRLLRLTVAAPVAVAAALLTGCGGGSDPVTPLVSQTDRANVAALESDLRSAAIAMETAYTETGAYPATAADIPGFIPSGGVQVTVARVTGDGYCLQGTVDGGNTTHYDSSDGTVATGPC